MVDLAKISDEEIKKAVSNNLGNKKYKIKDFKIVPASENPLGFLGEHERIKINVEIEGVEKILHYFCKKIPTKNVSHYEYAQKSGAFYKEIELLKTLFKDFENAKNVNNKKWLPEFYYARGSELLILEDLSIEGFYMYPERELVDLEHAQLAVDTMARMHAASFVFEDRINQGKVRTYSTKFTPGTKTDISLLYPNLMFETEVSDVKGHPGNKFYETGFKSEQAIIDLLPDYTPEQRQIIRENMTEKLKKVYQFVKPSKEFRNVLLHGDLWANNLMFRKDETGKVTDALIIDFQLARYGPPAHDIIMFLHMVQNREFRKLHEKSLLNQYYETLKKELKEEGIEINNVLTIEEFEKSVKYYREFAILNTIIYFQMIINPSDLMGKFLGSHELFEKNMYIDRSELIVACYKDDEICRSRVTDAVRDMAELYNWV